MQVKKFSLGSSWRGDVVENVPDEFNYEKIDAGSGVRDFIKYIKRGYTRPTHLAAINLRKKFLRRRLKQ